MNLDDFSRIINGDVLFDNWSRDIYSVDASNYIIKPELIVCPRDRYDVENLCEYCFDKNISLTPRGAGTGLLGQSLSNNIVMDFTKYMNKILEIESDYVIVEPGVVKGVLDKELKKRGKFLPPDPASGNYCTIGGMIANNSSGAHSLGYGSTIDFLQEVNIVYSDGTFSQINEESYAFDPLMIKLFKLLSPYLDIIQNQFPKVTKNSCGYRLDALFSKNKFSPQKIFASSEGTLGLVTSSK
ncbi:MAG TPA: FAD-binding oxidoreductase, partial [Candidatus Nitrosocosmicus sp.]